MLISMNVNMSGKKFIKQNPGSCSLGLHFQVIHCFLPVISNDEPLDDVNGRQKCYRPVVLSIKSAASFH